MISFYSWLHRAGVRRDPVFKGLVWRVSASEQRRTMSGIRKQIIPARGVRVTTDEIPGFPEVGVQCQLCDIDDVEKIEKEYETIRQAVEEICNRSKTDKAPDSAITTVLRSRQKIELYKAGAVIELARDKMDAGFSVGLFVNFRQTVETISRQLSCLFIDGTNTDAERQRAIDLFQENKTKTLVINSAAGGIAISLQDLDGEHPRFGIVSPPWSATTFRQLIGRFPRDGGKSRSHFRVLFAANTIETKMHAALRSKLDNLDALTDGDLTPDNLKL